MQKALLLLVVLSLPCVSLAQSNTTQWLNLNSLHSGQKIQITDTASKKYSGTFINASDASLAFTQTSGQENLQKSDIRTVKLMENKHRLRNTLILTGVGAGIGAGIGAAATDHGGSIILQVSHAKGAGVGAVLGAVGGVTLGALLPSRQTIYSVGPN